MGVLPLIYAQLIRSIFDKGSSSWASAYKIAAAPSVFLLLGISIVIKSRALQLPELTCVIISKYTEDMIAPLSILTVVNVCLGYSTRNTASGQFKLYVAPGILIYSIFISKG